MKDGDVVVLRCEGIVPGNRLLDGRTGDATVGLAASTDLSGTWWSAHDMGAGTFSFECLGHLAGNRWLDGRTGDGTVGLAPHTDPPYTGTRWKLHDLGAGFFNLECLGNLPGNRWLDGRTSDATVGLAPDLNPPYTGARWSISDALGSFTFDNDISAGDKQILLDRHYVAVARGAQGLQLSDDERRKLMGAYRRAIRHSSLAEAGVNARGEINGSHLWINFGVLFPQGDIEISQTLIHEMMHCAGYSHPTRRDPPQGSSCAAPNPAVFDCPYDNGVYYGTPPLRAELCIAGSQSDVTRAKAKAAEESCTVDEQGLATILQPSIRQDRRRT